MNFENKVAIVTGSTNGIGETIADVLHENGAYVVIASRNKERSEKKAYELDKTGQVTLGVECDVANPISVERMINSVMKKFGALHLAVNNAGITGAHNKNIPNQSIDDWNSVINTSLSGVFYCLKYEIPAMLKSGGGSIINLSAVNGLVGIVGLAPYTVAKHGVIGLTQSAALEFADKGIRVNAVAPGYVDTPRMREVPENVLEAFSHSHPMKRFATRREVANFVSFLLSDMAGFCTGGVYPIDGGYLAQ
ncbi:SDR family NAD(P)-dependent oxidoreductase [Pectobacterium parmentieri]|uniref:SDR family NAD(P)-dependent oxidoreductase n=1 Tax=Pectobacterium parmentieri TaxID=1905730 RepID=A0A8B3FCG9_PECPM|nr:SDR family NAD(P)-dependent oxidoreductase [Pectobacterium parmentieri]AOR58947.1 short-chain dehydrogenase [Pectobacterium parmentieri]AYH10021.1 SDR family NAD(P)-dependent oxidoreductase [Pectobacterium parmentieri]AYH19268.1 SDR family NAD(P)-dependent oxidoreductase [Pectobacterium parmentieri]AYH36341.1 SDR family NAD(P)-dependent oxidoreductase [Pectobacterium parmentieri]AZS56446.1 SDR family NAD(P)-dependent oxidoreductase [Pectobacterium parmentieri]